MNKTILKGIAESLEFDVEMGASSFSYHVTCQSYNDEECQLTVVDPDDPGHVQIASIKIGTVKESDEIAVQMVWRKKFWTRKFVSWGNLVDHLNEMTEDIKKWSVEIIKSL